MDIFPSYAKIGIRVDFFGDEVEAIRPDRSADRQPPRRHGRRDHFARQTFCHGRQSKIEKAGDACHRERTGGAANGFEPNTNCWRRSGSKSGPRYDLEMMKELGYCSGIENYSRHLAGREPGERPALPARLFSATTSSSVVDESHVTLPQIRGMYNGDRSRKTVLVEHGFRLPSALDNRPLSFEEFTELAPQVICVSRHARPSTSWTCPAA